MRYAGLRSFSSQPDHCRRSHHVQTGQWTAITLISSCQFAIHLLKTKSIICCTMRARNRARCSARTATCSSLRAPCTVTAHRAPCTAHRSARTAPLAHRDRSALFAQLRAFRSTRNSAPLRAQRAQPGVNRSTRTVAAVRPRVCRRVLCGPRMR